jgi:hypothetical protein
MTQPPGDPTQPAIPAQPGETPTAAEQTPPPFPTPQTAPPMSVPPMSVPPTLPGQPLYVPGQPQPYPPTQAYPAPPGYPPQYPPTQGYPQPFPPQPYPGYLAQPGYPPAEQPPRKRRGLLVGILAGVFVLLLAGGGVSTYLLTKDGGRGQASPEAAVDGFLTAVYTNHDATAAATFVCPQARDSVKLNAKIDEIKKQNSQYELPKYSWPQPVAKKGFQGPDTEVELVTVVTVRTSTEQHAEQPLTFIATRNNGWWVCEVKQGE